MPERQGGEGFGQHRLSDTIASPLAYTPDRLKERILAGRGEMEGQRKFVTILFADIQGSTALIENMDSEEALERLDPVVQHMIDAVHRYEGTVARVQGDGIMALFGAPLAREDHALQACKAALAMQSAVAARADPGARIRIGLHTGPVVVRSIAHDLSMHYDAVGAPVHVAARMEQLAEVGEIRITGDVLRLVEGAIEVRSVGKMSLKGIAEPIEVYALQSRRGDRSRWQVRQARGLTGFAGRAAELAALQRCYRAARGGSARLAVVSGVPGIGKSRLIHEFLAGIDDDVLVVVASAQPDGRTEPYYAVRNAMLAWIGISGADRQAAMERRVEGWLARLDAALAPFAPAYRFLLGLPVGDAAWNRLDPADRRAAMQRALAALLTESAKLRPLVLVVEDLHWIDAETEAALAAALPALAQRPVLIVLSSRPEYRHAWPGVPVETLALAPLAADEERRFLDALLGAPQSAVDLKSAIGTRAQGNPLYAEEILRALIADGAIRRDNVTYVAARSLASIDIPPTVQAVIASRIDALPAAPRALLEVASVVGQRAPAAILAAVAGIDAEACAELGAALAERNLFDPPRAGAEPEYAFAHALVRDVCYESILKSRRRVMHGQVLDAYETLTGDRVGENAGRLADHATLAERWDSAVKYGQAAGARAAELSAYAEAVRAYGLAIDAIGRTDNPDPTLAIDLRLAQQAPLGALGRIVEMERGLGEAETLCRGIGDRRRLGRVKLAQTFAFNYLGRSEEAIAAGTEGLELARSYQEHVLGLGGAYYLAQAHQWAGQYDRVVDLLAPEIGRFKGPLRLQRIGTTGTLSVLWHGLLGAARAYRGDFVRAAADADEAAAIAAETKRPYDRVISKWYQGFVRYQGGDAAAALPLLEEAHRLSIEARIAFLTPVVATSLGYAKHLLGRHADSIVELERAVQQSRQTRLAYAVAWSMCHLGEAYLAAGERDKAKAALDEALAIARTHRYRGVEETATRVRGGI